DILAAAYARAGRFPEAAQAARKALLLYEQRGQEAAASELRKRITTYE
ncbi:MAG: hypothetical protein GY953_16475, partial [bacterium]|nr:hypothetical protein [bacterium]